MKPIFVSIAASGLLAVRARADGPEAGRADFNGGKNYAAIGVMPTNGVRNFKYEQDGVGAPGQLSRKMPSGFGCVRQWNGMTLINVPTVGMEKPLFVSAGLSN
jgi:hypothetical protein